jgi:hypothetical protein
MDRSAMSLAAPERDAHRGAAGAHREGVRRTAARTAARQSLLALLRAFVHRLRYRPERHYMRGRRPATAPDHSGMVGVAR